MKGNFKVFDSEEKKIINDARFFLSREGLLYYNDYCDHHDNVEKANLRFIPVFSTGQNDKNGVELFDGDKLKTGHIIVNFEGIWCGTTHGSAGTRLGMGPLKDMEKIGSKYEEK